MKLLFSLLLAALITYGVLDILVCEAYGPMAPACRERLNL